MESIHVTIGDEGRKRFDEVVRGGNLPEGGDLELAVKDGATVAGKPGVVVTFTVLVDGDIRRAQSVTTLDAFLAAARILQLAYPEASR